MYGAELSGAYGFSFVLQEKEKALNLAIDVFCRLMRQHTNIAQLITMYEDTVPSFACSMFNFLLGTSLARPCSVHFRILEDHALVNE